MGCGSTRSVVLPPRNLSVLRAHTFGQCTFETSTSRIAPDAEVHFALLLSLVAGPDEGMPRDTLVERVWPQATLDDGRHCLRQAMYRLRQLDVPVRMQSGHVVLDWAQGALDLHTLLHGTTAREELVRLGALPFLPGYAPTLGDAFADWLESLRARVATRLRRALADEVLSARHRGRFHDMGQMARALLALDPLNEIGTCALAEALVLEGSKVEGLRLLEDYEDEVGAINPDLQVPVRLLRRRVSEVLDDSLALDRFESPFVGREREFAHLRALLREVRGGTAQAVFVTGEAGVGKTRLVDEVLRLAALDGATIARYTTSSGDAFTPISTLVSVGRLLLTLPGALGCDQEQLSYIRRLGVPEAVTTWNYTGMAADILYAQLVHAFAELVAAIADEAPLLLFLDDAERLHPTTWRVLVDIWDRVGDRSVFFLLGARRLPGWFGSLGARTCERRTQHIPLFAFGREESLAFLSRWSERNQVPLEPDLAQRLAGVSAGNPFHLSELAAHVARGGDPDQVPSGIHELITAQQLVLAPGTQRVLLAIAVLERRATTARVTRLLELPAAEFLAAIDELEAAGLVSTSGPELWCRHRLVGRVAIARSRESVLRFTHARAATLLESEAEGTDSVELLGDCVTHWEGAGEMKRAYEAAMKLGSRLVGMGMGEEARLAYQAARRCATTDSERLVAIEGAVQASRLCANWSEVVELCDERTVVRARLGTPDCLADEYVIQAAEASMILFVPNSLGRLLDIAASEGAPPSVRLQAATIAAMVADNDYDVATIEHATSLATERSLDGPPDPKNRCLLSLVYHTSIGDPRRAVDCAHDYAAHCRSSSDKREMIHGLRRSANALIRVGEYEGARTLLLDAIEFTVERKLAAQTFACSDLLASSYLHAGDFDMADRELIRQRDILSAGGSAVQWAMFNYTQSMLAWLLRDAERARAVLADVSPAQSNWLTASQFCSGIGVIGATLLLSPRTLNGREVEHLRRLYLRGRSLGRQDINTSVLCAALVKLGRHSDAERLKAEYATLRREITPPPTQSRDC